MGKWIPINKELPEENTHVMVSVIFEGKPYVTTDDYFCYGFDDWKDDVVAWQSLPEPYEDGDEFYDELRDDIRLEEVIEYCKTHDLALVSADIFERLTGERANVDGNKGN